MLDFSKLNVETRQDREERRAREEADRAVSRAAERQAKVRHTLTVTLVGTPEVRALQDGTVGVAFRFREDGRPDVKRAAWEPDGGGEMDAFLDLPAIAATRDAGEMEDGPRLTIAGGWIKRGWHGRNGMAMQEWAFKAMTVALADAGA